MFSIILGSIGFLCYFVYDINSVTKKNQILQRGFTVGSSLVFLGTIRMLIDGWANRNQNVLICLLWSVFGIVMFILLIYTLFFALPFNTTYVEKSNERNKVSSKLSKMRIQIVSWRSAIRGWIKLPKMWKFSSCSNIIHRCPDQPGNNTASF